MYKYIDDACINMNVYREKRVEEYLCRERERGRQANRAFPFVSQSILYIAVFVQNQKQVHHKSHFGFFLGIDLGLKFSCLLLTYINIY